MGKISPISDGKDFFIAKSSFKCDENIDLKNVNSAENKFFEHSLYDSFNFLNFNIINEVSKLIAESECVSVACFSDCQRKVNDFVDKLLDLGMSVNKIDSNKDKKNDNLYLNIDLLNSEEPSIIIVIKNEGITISNKKKFEGVNLVWAKSNTLDVSLEKKLEIFLNCIYMNILARKVL